MAYFRFHFVNEFGQLALPQSDVKQVENKSVGEQIIDRKNIFEYYMRAKY